jgi:hypothetical protein
MLSSNLEKTAQPDPGHSLETRKEHDSTSGEWQDPKKSLDCLFPGAISGAFSTAMG